MITLNKGLLACIFIAGLYSCEKHEVYKGGKQDDAKMTDLVVPADFDWKTADNVNCVLTATAPARVEVFTVSECTAASRIANLYVDAETEPLKLVIARGIENIYMRYMDREGNYQVQPVAVSNKEVNFALPEGSRNFSTLSVKSNDKDGDESEMDIEGTVLFEDNYPQKGDYDFNDYVITYDLDVKFCKRKLSKIEVELKFVAKGGELPYEPYLCLRGIKYQLMKNIEIDKKDSEKGVGVKTFEHLGKDNDLILKFTGVSEAMKRMQNEYSDYINTTKGHTTDRFVKLEFDIEFVGNAMNKYDGGDIFDFFLGGELKGQFTEIHERDFASTRLMTNGEVKKGEYSTEDNFVWVMKIDDYWYDDSKQAGDYKVFPYLNEKDNFLKGYPAFKGYVESTGKGNYDWCKKDSRVDDYLIFFKD